MTAPPPPPRTNPRVPYGRPAANDHDHTLVRPVRVRRHGRDDGTITILTLGLAAAVLACVGLLYDGIQAMNVRGRAYDLASQAARAGTNATTPASRRSGGPTALRIDPAAAQAAAHDLLVTAGATGTLSVTAPDTVVVTAHVPQRTAILGMLGIHDISGTATASATILHGTTTGRHR